MMITTRDKIYIPAILILIGMGLFSTCHYNRENRQHKRHIKELEKVNARNAVSIDSLKKSVAARDIEDSLLVLQVKSLYITTTDATPDSINAMPPDSFIHFITDFINRAGEAHN